ncbi:hypothetical protein BS329_40315 [Amycolatopsis coloradensis]|uniref:DUF3644 domain-containing protein n=1 Tax=Amycolatopsis coloradensis TaxID=76021 RepID=A0A1R0KDS8_9PSEU|nr:hypothetical protein BS329_40315 [Amycolatopsis coloradensis]
MRQRWPDKPAPVRANLEFFVTLRNKIEHRCAREQQALAVAVSLPRIPQRRGTGRPSDSKP